MPANDNTARDTAANIFDVAAQMASSVSATLSGEARSVLAVAAGIASAVGSLIRSVGVKDASELIAELQSRKSEGAISDSDIASDNESIAGAVSGMFEGNE